EGVRVDRPRRRSLVDAISQNVRFNMSSPFRILLAVVFVLVLSIASAFAQGPKGTVQGRVTDSSGAPLEGATVVVAPGGAHTVTDSEGGYFLTGLAPGDYTVTVSFVGLKDFSAPAHVVAGPPVRIDPKLEVGAHSEEIVVTADRPHGEVGQINRERT